MPKVHYLTKDEERKIIEYYIAGRSIGWLVSTYHCGAKKIKDILVAANIKIRSKEEQIQMGVIWNKKTTFEHYGVESVWQLDSFLEKRKKVCLEKYGVEYPTQLKSVIEKQKITNLARYGVEHPIQADSIKEKIKQTNLEKYGCENPMQNQEIRIKVSNTINNYSEEQKQQIIDKIKKANLEKYGVEYYIQTLEYHKRARKHYIYEDQIFDSLPELAFYLFHINNSINIERCTIRFAYIYNNSEHFYFPDFLVDGVLYEIKGDHFLKDDGTWQCPFDHTLDALYEAKHQCVLKNNVTILYHQDYKKYIDWFYENNYKKEDYLIEENCHE